MANVTSVTKHFPVVSETYTNNLSATISSGATVVPVNSAADYNDGDTVVLVVEPGTTNEAVFTGEKASSPQRFVNCVWTEGNIGVGHSSGATIVDYVAATHLSMMTKGLKVAHNNDGTLKTSAVQAALNISAAVPSDYTSLAQTATTVVANGNRSYTMTFPGVNYTDRLTPGMRLRTVRSAAAPNQSASLNGTNQYFNDTTVNGMTFTDDFTVSAWVKLSSYQAGTIASRFNGSNGWDFQVGSNGQISLLGYNGGAGSIRYVTSSQSIPLNKWVHITAQLDMSAFTVSPTTCYVMVDGVDVPAFVTQAGTNPTALIQAGNLEIGSRNAGTQLFAGKIAQVAIFNAKITQATIRGYMSQGLSGTETSLISAYTLSNSLNDLNVTNANHLTANGGAVATNADSPFGGQAGGTISTTVDYAIIQTTAYTTDTTVVVQVPEGCTIPTSGGVASISYSQFKAPYGFPTERVKWIVDVRIRTNTIISIGGTGTWWGSAESSFYIPVGAWRIGYQGMFAQSSSATGVRSFFLQMSESVTNGLYNTTPLGTRIYAQAVTPNALLSDYKEDYRTLNAVTMFRLHGAIDSASGTETWAIRGDQSLVQMFAENAYL